MDYFTDHLGNRLDVDDIVIAAMMKYRSSELRIGKVVELIAHSKKARIDWSIGKKRFYTLGKPISLINGYRVKVEDGTFSNVNGKDYPNFKDSDEIKFNQLLAFHKAAIDK